MPGLAHDLVPLTPWLAARATALKLLDTLHPLALENARCAINTELTTVYDRAQAEAQRE
jgi:hypothetical protein